MIEPQIADYFSMTTRVLATAPSVPGVPVEGASGSAGPTATGTPGTTGATPTGTQQAPPGNPLGMLLPVMLVVFGMLALQMFAGRKERKKMQAMLDGLRRYDEVQTAGGMIGKIVEVKTDRVVLKVDESTNTKIEVLKSAVTRVLKPSDAPLEAPAA